MCHNVLTKKKLYMTFIECEKSRSQLSLSKTELREKEKVLAITVAITEFACHIFISDAYLFISNRYIVRWKRLIRS